MHRANKPPRARARARARTTSDVYRPAALLALLTLASTTACTPDLTPSSEVVRPRILAARIEVEGDPERATPQPGETALLRLQVGFPERPPRTDPLLDLGAVFCIAVTLPNGTRFCLLEVPVEYELVERGPDELSVRFEVPDFDQELFQDMAGQLEEDDIFVGDGALPELALFGSLCVEGRAVREDDADDLNETPLTQVFRCERDDDVDYPYVIAFRKSLVKLELDNRNPDIACDAQADGNACDGTRGDPERVTADIALVRPVPRGEPSDTPREIVAWPEPPEDLPEGSFTGCTDEPYFDELRYRVGERAYDLRLRFDAHDRERLPDDPDRPEGASDIEELLVYAAHTEGGGTLDATLRLIEGDTPDDEMEVEFELEPPDSADAVDLSLPGDGRIIRFYFAVLDGRGGADFTSRALCLLPED